VIEAPAALASQTQGSLSGCDDLAIGGSIGQLDCLAVAPAVISLTAKRVSQF